MLSITVSHFRRSRLVDPDSVLTLLFQVSELVGTVLSSWQKGGNIGSKTSILRQLVRLMRLSADIKKVVIYARHDDSLLQLVAGNVLTLMYKQFHDFGITRDADSFLFDFEKSDLNSHSVSRAPLCSSPVSHDYFLSPAQWQVISPLIPPSQGTRPRGRPPADPLPLLDSYFWKVAHRARWQDLPPGYPPLLTCRRLYRRLFWSGRLRTIYHALHNDLIKRGQVDLAAFVEEDYFMLARNKIVISPGVPDTWQLRTALLFMQLGYQVLQRHHRRNDRERRRTWRF